MHCAGWTLWQRSLLCPSDNVLNCPFKILTKERVLMQRSLIKRGPCSSSHPLPLCPQQLHQCKMTPKITPGRGREPGASDPHLQLNCMVSTELVFLVVGWNLVNISLFTTFFNSDQHFKFLSYTADFLGMVCVGCLESGRPYHSLGIKESC